MESFVQLQKGSTPDRVHADLNGLKDDEMGRNGFIGRQAQFYRRNDPTAVAAGSRSQINHPIRTRDHPHVVFGHHHGIARVDQAVQLTIEQIHIGRV